MDYKEQILTAIDRAISNLALDRQLRDEAIAAFKKREQEEEEPIRLLIEQYFDEELKDCNGNTIRVGYILATKDNFPAYRVLNRGMQSFWGTPMFNPSVDVVTYSPLKGLGNKVKTLHRKELKDLQIMF